MPTVPISGLGDHKYTYINVVGFLPCVLQGMAFENQLEAVAGPECNGMDRNGYASICLYNIITSKIVFIPRRLLGAIQSISIHL